MNILQKTMTVFILNLIDTGFTQYHVHMNYAEELNPLVNILMVAFDASWMLAKMSWVAAWLWLILYIYPRLKANSRHTAHRLTDLIILLYTGIALYHLYLFNLTA